MKKLFASIEVLALTATGASAATLNKPASPKGAAPTIARSGTVASAPSIARSAAPVNASRAGIGSFLQSSGVKSVGVGSAKAPSGIAVGGGGSTQLSAQTVQQIDTMNSKVAELDLKVEQLDSLAALAKGDPGEPGQDGAPGASGNDGLDGREVWLQRQGGVIVWGYAGGGVEGTLTTVEELVVGPQGIPGLQGEPGVEGDQGIQGIPGREIWLDREGDLIVWGYVDEEDYEVVLADVSDLKGATGAKGADGADGTNGTNGVDGREMVVNENGEISYSNGGDVLGRVWFDNSEIIYHVKTPAGPWDM